MNNHVGFVRLIIKLFVAQMSIVAIWTFISYLVVSAIANAIFGNWGVVVIMLSASVFISVAIVGYEVWKQTPQYSRSWF